MNIRKFTENDRNSLRKIYYKSRKRAFYWLDSSLYKMTDFDRDTEGEIIWVATHINNLIGFISAWEQEDFIHNLFVHPELIRRGVGTKLLNVCLNEIGRPATLKCSIPNAKARRFYLSRGWRVISEGEGSDGKYELMQFENEI